MNIQDKDYIKFCLFGIPTWTLVDATWSSISQIANVAPEGYGVSAYLMLSLTLGNIVPLVLNNFLRNVVPSKLRSIIITILSIGFICGLLIAFLWSQTIHIGNKSTSLPLFLIFTIVGACSASSNVTHYQFVSRYARNDTSALSTGMAIGSMITGILGLAHGLFLSDLGMSLFVYYFLISCLYIPAFVAFVHIGNIQSDYKPNALLNNINNDDSPDDDFVMVHHGEKNNHNEGFESDEELLKAHYVLFGMQALNSFFGYGVIPALIAVICSRFQSPYLILLLSTSILCILDPMCRAMTAFMPHRTLSQLQMLSATLFLLAMLLLSVLLIPFSSTSFYQYGGFYPVILYISFGVCFGFSNTSVYLYVKCTFTNDKVISNAYRLTGIATQSGALLGSLISFLLVVSGLLY
jgi:hypothetical protein